MDSSSCLNSATVRSNAAARSACSAARASADATAAPAAAAGSSGGDRGVSVSATLLAGGDATSASAAAAAGWLVPLAAVACRALSSPSMRLPLRMAARSLSLRSVISVSRSWSLASAPYAIHTVQYVNTQKIQSCLLPWTEHCIRAFVRSSFHMYVCVCVCVCSHPTSRAVCCSCSCDRSSTT